MGCNACRILLEVGRDRGTAFPLVSSQVIDYSQETAVSPTVNTHAEMLMAWCDEHVKQKLNE